MPIQLQTGTDRTERQRRQQVIRYDLGTATGMYYFAKSALRVAEKYKNNQTIQDMRYACEVLRFACKELEEDIRKELKALRRETMNARNAKERQRRAKIRTNKEAK